MPRYLVNVDDKEFDIELEYKSEKYFGIINGKEVVIESHLLGENRSIMFVDDKSYEVDVRSNGYDTTRTVFILGQEVPVTIENYTLAQLKKTAGMSSKKTMDKILKAPMPGLVLELKVSEGISVKKGEPLLIIEAMKMENVIKSAGEGIIKKIIVKAGQSVEKDDRLLEFE